MRKLSELREVEKYRRKAFKNLPNKCKFCGVKEHLTVHHLDGNKNNNLLTNLIILCNKCHNKKHNIKEKNGN